MTVVRDYAARAMNGRPLISGPVPGWTEFIYAGSAPWSKRKAAVAGCSNHQTGQRQS